MKTDTSEKIIKYVKKKGPVRPKELVEAFDISERAVFKQLRKLREKNRLYPVGKPPKVYYMTVKEDSVPYISVDLPKEIESVIEENYFLITPTGEEKGGLEGFVYWCKKNNLPIKKTAVEYVKTLKKYQKHKKKGFIDATYKLKDTFENVFMDKLFYIDFYSIERFGKTKLGWKLLYAKQSQDKHLVQDLVNDVKYSVMKLIRRLDVEAVGYIPPTVKREIQFMKELEKKLSVPLPAIKFIKLKTPIVVPQKSLITVEDRVINARRTIQIDEKRKFKNVLLIDDAVGSGATMNEVAKKLKEQKVVSGNVYGLALVGSFKGFEVISEV